MQSTCPNCKKQIEHEDFLFEVVCSCGSRFNPFMGLSEAPPLDGVDVPVSAPAAVEGPESFEESQAVFNELKEFAEGTNMGKQANLVVGTPLDGPPKPPTRKAKTPQKVTLPSDAIMTAGDGLPGYHIDEYLPPVSASGALDPHDPNPLGRAFETLWAQAVAIGATGVVAVRWVLLPEGNRVLMSGTPVRCSKE